MNDHVVLQLNAAYGRKASSEAVGLEAKTKASMRAVLRENWVSTDETEQFHSAVLGVLLDVGKDSDDGQTVIRSMEALRKFEAAVRAAQSGVAVDFMSALPEDPAAVLPLLEWWKSVKEEKTEERKGAP